jgi:hypothetical protein
MKMAVLMAALILAPLPTLSQEAQRTESGEPSNEERSNAGGEQPGRASGFYEPASSPQPAVDVKALPSIDSLAADSDIRPFLQPGVPAELTIAALRRAWTIDPAIRDFIEIAENQWDFTDLTRIPGFGPLEATDDIGRIVAQAHGPICGPIPPRSSGSWSYRYCRYAALRPGAPIKQE